jgi:hypothetical protein
LLLVGQFEGKAQASSAAVDHEYPDAPPCCRAVECHGAALSDDTAAQIPA